MTLFYHSVKKNTIANSVIFLQKLCFSVNFYTEVLDEFLHGGYNYKKGIKGGLYV